jgi:hypothetical protein
MSISSKKHLFFVRPDNFHFKDDRQNIRVFYAMTGQELLEQILEYYKFENVGTSVRIEIWSHQMGTGCPRIRLDTMTELTDKYETAWIRILPIRSSPTEIAKNHWD